MRFIDFDDASLTLVESSPVGGDAGELPAPDARIAAAERTLPDVRDWTDAASVIDYRVEAERPCAGGFGFDEARIRGIAAAEVGRAKNMESSMTNHFLVAAGAVADPSTISCPTLVIHSDTDPLFPLPHGEALVRMIPSARLWRAGGMGHEAPPPRLWSTLVPALAAHVTRA